MAPRMINYAPNAIIYFSGDKANSIYLLKKGKIVLEYNDVHTGEEISDTINTGEFFGVKSGLIRFPREEDAKVMINSEVIEFSTDEFELLITKNTSIILKMLRSFSNQLRRLGKQVQKLVTNKGQTDPAIGLFSIGDYYYKTKKYTQALVVYERFLKYYPSHNLCNKTKERMDRVKEALDSFGNGGGPTPHIDDISF